MYSVYRMLIETHFECEIKRMERYPFEGKQCINFFSRRDGEGYKTH